MTTSYRLSVLDQSPIPDGHTAAEALANTLDLATRCDALGYDRYWLAEHHASPGLAGVAPEALIGPVALATKRIRVGSGGIMLPHYSPFKVTEVFRVLDRFLGLPLVVLGTSCLAVLLAGRWLKRIAGEAQGSAK